MRWKFSDDTPIYAQIVRIMKLAIASGELRDGERLPSVRELAVEAGVNPNTMQRALAELEREGLVYAQRTAGRFVTDDEEKVGMVKNEMAEQHIMAFLTAMQNLGFAREELPGLIMNFDKGGCVDDGNAVQESE